MTLTNYNRKMKLISTMASGLLIVGILAGCSKGGVTEQSTADRVKRVEERQKSDANFHAERKMGVATPGQTAGTGKPVTPAGNNVAAGEATTTTSAR